MLNIIEDKRNEFKVKLTDDFEKEVIAFLNTEGGNIFIGVNDKGEVVGNIGNIDLLQRTIKAALRIILDLQHWGCSMSLSIN